MTVLDRLAALLVALSPSRRVRVAVDGVDASGKTTLADALAPLVARSRPVVRASVDGFHCPRHVRYARGRLSPEGCYRDTYDLDAFRSRLLDPFAAGEPVVTAVFDHVRDEAVSVPAAVPAPGAVLLVDGVFLQRPELADPWDLVVHLRVPDEEVLRRAAVRDGDDALPVYRARYLPAQRLYEAACSPADRADVVLDTTAAPVVLRWPT